MTNEKEFDRNLEKSIKKVTDENEFEGIRLPKRYMIPLKFVAKRAAEFLDDENLFHFLTKLMMDNEEPDPAGSAKFLMENYKTNNPRKVKS